MLIFVPHWPGKGMAKFQLTDSFGNAVERLAQQGDYFRIGIPVPRTIIGNGHDWVEVKALLER